MAGFDGNSGTSRLANVLTGRMRKESESPLMLDFGEIQANGSLVTNTFPVPIPKGDYSVCRQLTLGMTGDKLTETGNSGSHIHYNGEHDGHSTGDGSHVHNGGEHSHIVYVPEKMRSLCSGDRVLVAWVQSEAVVIDIITSS